MGTAVNGDWRKAKRHRGTDFLAVVSVLSVLTSCHKIRAMAGDPSAQQQATPTKITGYEDGQEINVNPGPLPTPAPAGANQGWHVQPLKCSVDEKLLGMCGDSPLPSTRSSTYVPSYATPQASPYHQHYGRWSKTHY